MAKNDEWCEFCNDRMKQTVITLRSREWEVCNWCSDLTVLDERLREGDKRWKSMQMDSGRGAF